MTNQATERKDLKRRLEALALENQRLRNLLRVTDGVARPLERPVLAPADPGMVRP
ncbi:MAG: hypothetical protein IPJ61_08660 [Tessaracoccus sp.]|uniref:hypothetical protein n=1 Tax=Tessaracoccus sp. TaxID=1971211 RepID=UPI001EC072B9|nr:hypothetical protein [Tessaracoccus sp.]MBK7821132.1 hypothetical protein [Tessaracoccus sp.]